MAAVSILAIACNNKKEESGTDKMVSGASDSTGAKPQSEFADTKYTEWGKKNLAAFEAGDIDSWMNAYADNAVYSWSAGDSLAGKKSNCRFLEKKKK